MKVLDLVKIVFENEITDNEAEGILWGCTGFPSFFKSNDAAKCFYYQLTHAKRSLKRGFSIDDIFCGKDKIQAV